MVRRFKKQMNSNLLLNNREVSSIMFNLTKIPGIPFLKNPLFYPCGTVIQFLNSVSTYYTRCKTITGHTSKLKSHLGFILTKFLYINILMIYIV